MSEKEILAILLTFIGMLFITCIFLFVTAVLLKIDLWYRKNKIMAEYILTSEEIEQKLKELGYEHN